MAKFFAGIVAFIQSLFFAGPAGIPPAATPSGRPVAYPSPVVLVTYAPTASPTRIPVTPRPTAADTLDYYYIKSLLGLEDKEPVMPPDGFENGLSINFRQKENPATLHTYQKMLVEEHAFLCQMENQSDWRVYGANNSRIEKKYGYTSMTDDQSSYYNLIAQNPQGWYDSQRNDLIKVRVHYCGDKRDTQMGF